MGEKRIDYYLSYLGMKVKDKVTGFSGIVTSISFDLYGCIQALVNPGLKDGKFKECSWFDISRLKFTGSTPVMRAPNFFLSDETKSKSNDKGPAEKPLFNKP
jgi:hypothetical protein